MKKTLTIRIIGFGLSLLLTLAAFLVVAYPNLLNIQLQTIVVMILVFAVLQAIVQSICFLHILSEKGSRWNLFIYTSTIMVVFVIIAFSIWVMNHLNYNMGM